MDFSKEVPIIVKTYVFLDLETTGCDNNSRIIELSMVALSRSDLLSMGKNAIQDDKESSISNLPPALPRVLHKFTKLYNPRQLIYPRIEQITGLNNENTEHLLEFTAESATAIKCFLNFPEPICLIAHNGTSFDFPILKSELQNSNTDLNHVECADSLIFARQHETEDIISLSQTAQTNHDDENANETSQITPPCSPPDDIKPCTPISFINNDDAKATGSLQEVNPLYELANMNEIKSSKSTSDDIQPFGRIYRAHDIRKYCTHKPASIRSTTNFSKLDLSRAPLSSINENVSAPSSSISENVSAITCPETPRPHIYPSVEDKTTCTQVSSNEAQIPDTQDNTNNFTEPVKWMSAESYFTKRYETLASTTETSSQISSQNKPSVTPMQTPEIVSDILYEPTTSSKSDFNSGKLDLTQQPSKSLSNGIYHTPYKQKTQMLNKKIPCTPAKHFKSQQNSTPEHNAESKPQTCTQRNSLAKNPAVKRVLHYDGKPSGIKKPFSQPTLYNRLFEKDYEAHRAESDALALLQICGYYGQDFVDWVDTHCTPFHKVKPKWSKSKSFIL